MRIHRLELRNFRCFERLELQLHERMTLLVGTNGAGKSSVLDALAIALGAWLGGTAQAAKEDRTIVAADARLVRQAGVGLATINPSFPVQVTVEGELDTHLEGVYASIRTKWMRELGRIGGRTTTAGKDMLRLVAEIVEEKSVVDETASLPLIAYYGTGRLWVQKRDKRATVGPRSRMDGYTACLEFASNHKLFERWMADREGARLQQLETAEAAGTELAAVRTPHLEAVQNAACACLEGARRFYYSMNHQELRVEFDDGSEIPFSNLSDGQRSLIVLAADIAWRAAQLNPHHAAEAPSKTKGIVLIDEVELHLHPQWQRTVVGNLLRVFEGLQFVMTTHSPQVVSAARPEWMRIIHSDGSSERVDYTYGRDSNALLRDVFGIPDRLKDVRERIDAIEAQLGSGELEGARAALELLAHDLGPNDHVVAGLQWELLDAETHGIEPDPVDHVEG